MQALVLHIDGIALGHADGRAVHLGSFLYDFAYVPAGLYRIAFSCSGEWDEAEDDDYPSDPDGRFDFQVFSDPVEVMPGQMQAFDIVP